MSGEMEKEHGKEEQVEEITEEPKENPEVEVLPPDGQEGLNSEDAQEYGPEELSRLLKEQTEKAEDNYARLVRLQADFENFRRRTSQEKENLAKFATENLMLNLLQVLDNFERALSVQDLNDNQGSFMEGMQMIYRQLQEVLSKEGLTPIPAVDEQFDPNKHDAVMQEETDEKPDNTILEELRRGYMLKDKVIRPSMVKVAKSV